jgi:hypothetical protein
MCMKRLSLLISLILFTFYFHDRVFGQNCFHDGCLFTVINIPKKLSEND